MGGRDVGGLRLWVRGHLSLCSGGLIATGVVLRIVLALRSPQPWGYAWDRYYEGVRILYETGSLPIAMNCWQCYHPPVFYALGAPLYALGVWWFGADRLAAAPDLPLHFVTTLSFLCAGLTVFYCDRILRHYDFQGEYRLLGLAIALALPLLFISSWGIEADIVLTACMCAFLYEILRYFSAPDGPRNLPVAAAIWAGLAVGTKYNGLLAPLTGGVLIAVRLLPGRDYRRLARDAAVFAAIVACLGGWKYADNALRYGKPLLSNGTAMAGFTLDSAYHWDTYEFATFRLGLPMCGFPSWAA